MCSILFENVVCQGRLQPSAKYRLVIPSVDGLQGELKSAYTRGSWERPFGDAIAQPGNTEQAPELSVTVTVTGLARVEDAVGTRPDPESIEHDAHVVSAAQATNDVDNHILDNGDKTHDPITTSILAQPVEHTVRIDGSSPLPRKFVAPPSRRGRSRSPSPEKSIAQGVSATFAAAFMPSVPALSEDAASVEQLLSSADDASDEALHEQSKIRSRSLSFASLGELGAGSENAGDAMWSGVSQLDSLYELLDVASEIHPLVRGAWSLLSLAYKLAKQQSDLDAKIKTLISVLDASCRIAKELAKNQLTNVVEYILKQLLREVLKGGKTVKEYCVVRTSQASTFRFAGSLIASQVDASLEALDIFRRRLDEHTTISIQRDLQSLASSLSRDLETLGSKLEEVHAATQNQHNESLLHQMPFAPEADRALRNSERGCLPDTRVEIMQAIVDWALGAEPGAEQPYISSLKPHTKVLWLCGVAGSGKSSIAISVARALRSMDRLGALYGFETAFQASLNPTNLFSTIARQRAERRPTQKRHLLDTLEHLDRDQRATTSAPQQFKTFLASPAHEDAIFDDIIIIDAFDESASVLQRAAVLLALSPEAHNPTFPADMRFIVTSRYDLDVARRLESVINGDQALCSVLHMEDIRPEHTERDIERYITHMLGGTYGLEAALAAGDLARLAVTAEHSFQWASTSCRYIIDSDDHDGARLPDERLQETLATRGGLDELYLSILDQSFGLSIARESPATRSLRMILGTLVCALEPVSIQVIAALASANQSVQTLDLTGFHILAQKLSSIVTGTQNTSTPLVAFHTSFTDFLQDKKRSERYAVASTESHLHLALSSLAVMKQSLRFNICRLETSFLPNGDVPDLAERAKMYIPDELSYACRFWPVHVAAALSVASGDTEALRDSLSDFLENKLRVLQWLEVMSVTRSNAWSALSPISFLQSESSHLRGLIAFTTYFAIPISTSVPHIYLSALAFTPSSSHILPALSLFPNLVQPSKPLASWPQIRQKFEHASAVQCVAFSPDGRWLVSAECRDGSYDSGGGLVLWDAFSGMALLPRISTTSGCLSVAFLPNKTVLASGHKDGTVQLWDASSMTARGKPLSGHTDWVRSLSLSPDGKLLASGSDDGTIRFWDPHSGSALGEPLFGHDDGVRAVSFSPNGSFLASGSEDCRVRIWDVRTSSAIGTPIQGHSDWVRSVAFSPDSTLLATGADDKTIGLWDVHSGSAVGKVFSGHKGYVRSVSFSPDGYTLASCSDDQTVRLWDVRTQAPLGEPLTGHTDNVASITFSPDGALLASASFDKTVHVWDARVLGEKGESPATQLKVQNFAAFSRDGKFMATGSNGSAIQLWDVHSASLVGEPLEGHTHDVQSAAFSPDGTLLASGFNDATVRLWDVSAGSAVGEPLKGHSGWVNAVAFSPDGELLASGSKDMTVRLWDVASRTAVGDALEGHSHYVLCVAFSPNGELLASGSADKTIRLWDVNTRSLVGESFVQHSDTVLCVAFSPDGILIASGSGDGTVRIWDVRTRSPVKELLQHDRGGILCVAWSPDGMLLASGDLNKTVRLWDLRISTVIGEPLRRHTGFIDYLAFSPGRTQLISTADGDSICYWDVSSIMQDASLASNSELQHPRRVVLPVIDPLPPLHPHALRTLEDGWVVGPSKELILWIPPALRSSISNVYEISGLGGPPIVHLDFSKFVCGPDWAKCYSPSSDSVAPAVT